ncbi:MAG: VWA domain-containing protein [Eubacteriales bacterium]|nr:VWA domain-containing protein [Eubacteriales bacterium]
MTKIIYPFTAIVGQENLKTALLLNLINPKIGGVLISGQKGTVKSTAVRAVAKLTDKQVITLPLSVTEDRLTGSIDLEATMKTGKSVFLPGILSQADGQILYIDEVNLLQDHITDLVLCAHSAKENRIEREGISYSTSSNFILIGTMNPEEGQLRQHFLDQFGLCVVTEAENNLEQRVAITKARITYEENPKKFTASYTKEESELKEKILQATKILTQICIREEERFYIVNKCLEANVQGHRADLILEETAKAMAAWNGRLKVTEEDIDRAAVFVLRHRCQKKEKEETETGQQKQEQNKDETLEEEQNISSNKGESKESLSFEKSTQGYGGERTFSAGNSFKVTEFGHQTSRQIQKGFGKRTNAKSAGKMGRYIYSVQQNLTGDLALDATIRAAAPYQQSRPKNNLAISIKKADIREKVRQRKYANLLVFVVDASGSMGASQRMTETKGAILSLLKDAYVKRDKICLIAFRDHDAQILLPPTRSIERGARLLETMAVGGRTPLNAGISRGIQVIQSELKKNPSILPYMIMITDGKGNVSIDKKTKPKQELMEISEKLRNFAYINTMVLDIERKGAMSFGIAKEMAGRMGARYEKIETLKSTAIINAIERVR